jgi:hypothetical protein
MASPTTLAAAILGIRRRANIEKQYAFIPDVELVEYYYYCATELYDLLIELGFELNRTTWPLTTNSTDDTYPLPPDFYKLISMAISYDTNVIVPIRPYMETERHMYQNLGGWNAQRPAWYRLVGKNVRFIPSPNSAYTVQINGYPIFAKFAPTYTDATQRTIANGDAIFDGVNGWEELAIWRAVVYCKQKGEEDATFAMQRASEIEQRIRTQAANRDTGNPDRVVDVLGGVDPGYW